VRIIKLALISFLFFFVLLTIMSLFIPSHVRISRAINIASTNQKAMLLVEDTTEWRKWHPLFKESSIATVLGSNKVTWRTITKTDSLFVMSFQQENKEPVTNSWQLHRLASSDSTALQWYMDFQLKWYPWQKFGGLFYEKTYGTMMEQGLNDLKNAAQ